MNIIYRLTIFFLIIVISIFNLFGLLAVSHLALINCKIKTILKRHKKIYYLKLRNTFFKKISENHTEKLRGNCSECKKNPTHSRFSSKMNPYFQMKIDQEHSIMQFTHDPTLTPQNNKRPNNQISELSAKRICKG